MAGQNNIDLLQFEKLFKNHYTKLCQMAWQLLKNEEEAEDLVQQFYIKVWEKREILNIDVFYLYAQKSIRNRCLDKLLRENKFQYEPIDTLINTLAEYTDHNDDFVFRDQVRCAIRKIPRKSRQIMLLHCLRDLKYKEVAELLGISINTVKSQIAIAYRIFTEEMQGIIPVLLLFSACSDYLLIYFLTMNLSVYSWV